MQKENLIEKKEEQTNYKISWDLETKREVAKIGMTASLVTLVATSFYLKTKTMKTLHTAAGAAMVGFSFWHHMLYQPNKKEVKNAKRK